MKWTKQCGTTLQPRGWGLKYLLHLPHLASSIDLKRMQTLHSLSRDIAADKTSITSYRGGRRQNCGLGHPLQFTTKAIPEDNGRFWLQNQSRSLGAALWLWCVHSVGQTSQSTVTNKGSFQIGGGRNQLAIGKSTFQQADLDSLESQWRPKLWVCALRLKLSQEMWLGENC